MLWRRHRVATALLVAVVGFAACGSRTVVTDLEPAEAQRCAVVLRSAGLDASVERDDGAGESSRRLTVHGDDADYRSALQLLEEHNLPHRRPAGFADESSSLIPTATEERARFIKGLSGEIEAMLESIDGVVAAEAVVSVPERRPLIGAATEPASASVVVSHADATSPITADEVRALVVQAVGSALTPERVTVLLKPIVRSRSAAPIVRYQRDRTVELAFLGCMACLGTVVLVTLHLLRNARARVRTLEDDCDDRSA